MPAAVPELREQGLTARQIGLVRTTYRLIAEKGVRRLSLQEIADEAGVSKSLLLYHFGRKQTLILATMRWVLLQAGGRIRAAVDAAEAPVEKVEAMVDAIFVDPEANRRFYLTQLDLLDHALRFDDFERLSASFRAIVNALYEEVVALGAAAGAFAVADVGEASVALRAIVDGLFLQWIQEKETVATHARYRETCKRTILAYLGVRLY